MAASRHGPWALRFPSISAPGLATSIFIQFHKHLLSACRLTNRFHWFGAIIVDDLYTCRYQKHLLWLVESLYLYMHVCGLNMHWNRSVCDCLWGREAVDKPILNTEKASEILKTSCNCAGVLIFSCAILNDNHLRILLFWRTLKQDAQSLKLWSLLQVPDLLLFLQHQPLMMCHDPPANSQV